MTKQFWSDCFDTGEKRMSRLNVLVGCEESGVLRDEFLKLGQNAFSCDIIPTRGDPTNHIIADIMDALHFLDWDIIVCHPDCTSLAVSGNGTYGKGKEKYNEREKQILWCITLFEEMKKTSKIGCALENPVSVIWKYIGAPQYIQPWQFGHGETKKTGILTYRLPQLRSTNIVSGREQRIWKMPPSPTRKRDRSVTYKGIAEAMATQYVEYALSFKARPEAILKEEANG